MKVFLILLLTSISVGSMAITMDLSDDLLEEPIHDTIIVNKTKKLLKSTMEFLTKLDDGDEYGSIGWPNSMAISIAKNKLKGYLDSEKPLTASKLIEYDEKIQKFFKKYIVEDLNKKGAEIHSDTIAKQIEILELTLILHTDEDASD